MHSSLVLQVIYINRNIFRVPKLADKSRREQKLKKKRAHASCPSADENPMTVTKRNTHCNRPTSSLAHAEFWVNFLPDPYIDVASKIFPFILSIILVCTSDGEVAEL